MSEAGTCMIIPTVFQIIQISTPSFLVVDRDFCVCPCVSRSPSDDYLSIVWVRDGTGSPIRGKFKDLHLYNNLQLYHSTSDQ